MTSISIDFLDPVDCIAFFKSTKLKGVELLSVTVTIEEGYSEYSLLTTLQSSLRRRVFELVVSYH